MSSFRSLPTELMLQVLTETITTSECALRVFCPELGLCAGRDVDDPAPFFVPTANFPDQDITRFDTITFGTDGAVVHASTRICSTQMGSCGNGHDNMTFPHLESLGGQHPPRFNQSIDNYLALADNHLFVFSQHFHHAGLADESLIERIQSMDLLRDPAAARILPYVPDLGLFEPVDAVKETLPGTDIPMYRHIRHLVLNTREDFLGCTPRHIAHFPLPVHQGDLHPMTEPATSPLRLRWVALQQRIEADQRAHIHVDFASMPRLETLFLDLANCDLGAMVVAARNLAARAAKFGTGLRLLVLNDLTDDYAVSTGAELWLSAEYAGQRLGRFAGWDSSQHEKFLYGVDVPYDESEVWQSWTWYAISMFAKALRPGGRLMLVSQGRIERVARDGEISSASDGQDAVMNE
jgi:hypothetical protein